MKDQEKRLLQKQLERQGKELVSSGDDAKLMFSLLATSTALLRTVAKVGFTSLNAQEFDNLVSGYLGIADQIKRFCASQAGRIEGLAEEQIQETEKGIRQLLTDVEQSRASYLELKAYYSEIERIREGIREEGYADEKSYRDHLIDLNLQTEQLLSQYDSFLKKYSSDINALRDRIEKRTRP